MTFIWLYIIWKISHFVYNTNLLNIKKSLKHFNKLINIDACKKGFSCLFNVHNIISLSLLEPLRSIESEAKESQKG